MISKFIDAAVVDQDITLYGDSLQTRTFCYIDDNIEAATIALYLDKLVNDVVKIGSDFEMTIKELAELIIQETASQSRFIHLPPVPEGDMTRRKPDIGKMRQLLSRELIPIDEGIRKIVALWRPSR